MSLAHHIYDFQTGLLIGNFTRHIQRYEHEHTALGPYTSSFACPLAPGVTTKELLAKWFARWPMQRLITTYEGAPVWDGFIWEVTLDLGNITRQFSMEKLHNRVKASKRDEDDSSITRYTDWFTNEDSRARYGTHEFVIAMDGALGIVTTPDGTPVTIKDDEGKERQLRDHDLIAWQHVREFAFPNPAHSIYPGENEPELRVTAVGRQTIANRIQLSDGWLSDDPVDGSETSAIYLRDNGLSGTTSGAVADALQEDEVGGEIAYEDLQWSNILTVSEEIRRVVGVIATNGGWLYEKDISQENITATAAGVSRLSGTIDRLRELAQIPTPDGVVMDLRVTPDGGVIYGPRLTRPYFILYPDGLKHSGRSGEPVGWRAHIAPIRVADPAMSLSDTDIIYAERVTVANNEATFTTLERNEADTYAAIRANTKWREDLRDKRKNK